MYMSEAPDHAQCSKKSVQNPFFTGVICKINELEMKLHFIIPIFILRKRGLASGANASIWYVKRLLLLLDVKVTCQNKNTHAIILIV